MAQRYLFWVRFNGAYFSGLAKTGSHAEGVMTLFQPAISDVLAPFGFKTLKASPGSRTDAGVHAFRAPILVHVEGQTCMLDENEERKASIITQFHKLMNQIERPYLELLDFHRVSNGFSTRRHVSYRRYVYRLRVARLSEIYTSSKEEPSLACVAERHRAWTLSTRFDLVRANDACRMLQGLHNMASFYKHTWRARQGCDVRPSTTKYIQLARLVKGETFSGMLDENFDYYNFEVVSKSFLREQVRRMVGLVVAYAKGNVDRKLIEQLLRYPDPQNYINSHLKAAPGHGLYLVNVVYDPKMFIDPQPYISHGWDDLEIT